MGLRIALYNSNFFDRQLRFVAEQPFAQLNSKVFSLGEYVLSPVWSAIEV